MLEKLKDTFDKSVAAVSVKSESIVESSRVKTAITSAQRDIDAAVNALGVKFYNSWANESVDMAALEEDCAAIRKMYGDIAALRDRLEQIKAEENRILGSQKKPGASLAGGAVFCTNCGKKLDASMRFCDECGTPVKG